MTQRDSGNPEGVESPMDRGDPARTLAFRSEAMRRHANPSDGAMSLAVPLSFSWYSLAAFCLIGLLIAFLAFGSYTTTESSEAVVQTAAGVFDIRGKGEGVVATIKVREGDLVGKGDVLMTLRPMEESVEEDSGDEEESSSDRDEDSKEDSEKNISPDISPEESHPEGREGSKRHAQDGKDESTGEDAGDDNDRILTIRSPMKAIVYQLPVAVGNNYNAYSSVVRLAGEGELIVSTMVGAETHALLTTGQRVELRIKAFKGTTKARLLGKIASIALTPTEQFNRKTMTSDIKYKVVIGLDASSMRDPTQELLGKQVEVLLPIRKRMMYQWLFDPLRTLLGNG